MKKLICYLMLKRINKLQKERKEFMNRRLKWPVESFAYARMNFSYKFWGFKIEFLKALVK